MAAFQHCFQHFLICSPDKESWSNQLIQIKQTNNRIQIKQTIEPTDPDRTNKCRRRLHKCFLTQCLRSSDYKSNEDCSRDKPRNCLAYGQQWSTMTETMLGNVLWKKKLIYRGRKMWAKLTVLKYFNSLLSGNWQIWSRGFSCEK